MNNIGDNDFDELEPRVTPQPTVLKCITTPSVPELSIIFAKCSDTTQLLNKTRNTREAEHETYASWKRDEFPAAIQPKVDSSYAIQLLNKSDNKFRESPLKNSQQYQSDKNKNIAIRGHNIETVTRNTSADNVRFHNHDHHNEMSAFPFPRTKSVELPVQKRSYDGVKSILKNSLLERTEVINSSGSPDCRFQRKTPRCHRQMDINPDQGTVRDLLLLVQNQNEQIKSLQNQVERLLQAHEESLGYRESRAAVSKKPIEKPPSPIYNEDDKLLGNNAISPQKPCHSRGMKIMSPYPSDEPPEVCLRYQGDQMRNTIMEKKVSIGVMTSFEFSVQNNPFVSDSDHQINAVLRECGKNIGDSGENWRTCSRNIVPGPLENINEDSESYPSSLWKQSNNNTQMSSTEKTTSKRAAIANENRVHTQSPHQCSPFSKDARSQSSGNDSTNFFNKSARTPVPAPRKLSSSNREQGPIPLLSEQPIQNADNLGTFNNVVERKANERHCLNDRNNYNRATTNAGSVPYLAKSDRFPRNSESFNTDMKSMAAENTDEASLVLSSSDLRFTDRPPSPDPSIHVEMREYSSDDENEKSKRVPPVGWTFYKNIVGQVNRILHTIPDTKDLEENEQADPLVFQNETDGREEVADSVKLATLERLKMLGISYAEHSEFAGEHVQKKVTFDSSYYPRLDYQTTFSQPTSTVTESNTSMHMKALALKYLSDEQLADLAVQKQGDGSGMKHKILNSVHGTNMSLATMNYLQRYCLVSGVNTPHAEGKGHVNTIRQKKLKHVVMTKELHAQPMPRHHAFDDSANKKEADNILDITTLKQQPKLL